MNVLIIGSGGREHAIAWKIKQSPLCHQLYILPGNAGTADLAQNIPASINDFEGIEKLVLENEIELVVVGPEEPLVNGITDHFRQSTALQDVKIVGPDKKGAMLEGSKDFAKAFMQKYEIPTAQFKTFTSNDYEVGLEYIESLQPPIVLKADGLAAGKGVIIAQSITDAKSEFTSMLVDKKFGEASKKVVIEEFLDGIELSVFVITDGENYVILPEAKDYKRIGENDTGPNTGGMGAVSPVPFADNAFMMKVENEIIKPTVTGLDKENMDYRGFLFIGLMNVGGNPYVIEYNVRMGDPETQAVMTRIDDDLVSLLLKTATKSLEGQALTFSKKVATTVVMVSGGYPGKYEKGKKIKGIDCHRNALLFQAGTTTNIEGEVITNGGRVLALTGTGKTIEEALNQTYSDIENITWDNVNFRKDIGQDILNFTHS